MKKYNCIIFDLDGTLANTYPGIFNSYHYACEIMGIELPTDAVVGAAIGAPLLEVFEKRFQLDRATATTATEHYRKYYAEKGIYEANAYEGMQQTLKYLKENGYLVALATLKKEEFAKDILNELKLAEYFDLIVGMNAGDSLTKAQMLEKVCGILKVDRAEAVLVGDSSYDAIGAKEAGMDFIAVTYGFGFKNADDISDFKTVEIVNSSIELMKVL